MLRFLCAKLFQKPVRVFVVKTGMPLKRPAAFQMNDALPGIQAVQMMLRRHERQQRLIVRMSYKLSRQRLSSSVVAEDTNLN